MHSIDEEGCSRIALLYCAFHCRDLQKKLENLCFLQTDEQWKTAWSAEVPPLSTSTKKSTQKNIVIYAFDKLADPFHLFSNQWS